MNTLFISDLHLCPRRPLITQIFLDFLVTQATQAQALYILGDFFDNWIGDDVMDEFAVTITRALRALSDKGVRIYLMPGNRDFLYGQQFAQQSGLTLIQDPTCIDLYGTPTLLVHGDSLCSADQAFQIYRAFVRHPVTKWLFLHLPLFIRKKIAAFLRNKSSQSNLKKSDYLMEVVQSTVEEMMRRFHVTHMIHGHTHVPGVHHFDLEGKPATRTVLGPWETQGHVLICKLGSQQPVILPDPAQNPAKDVCSKDIDGGIFAG